MENYDINDDNYDIYWCFFFAGEVTYFRTVQDLMLLREKLGLRDCTSAEGKYQSFRDLWIDYDFDSSHNSDYYFMGIINPWCNNAATMFGMKLWNGWPWNIHLQPPTGWNLGLKPFWDAGCFLAASIQARLPGSGRKKVYINVTFSKF